MWVPTALLVIATCICAATYPLLFSALTHVPSSIPVLPLLAVRVPFQRVEGAVGRCASFLTNRSVAAAASTSGNLMMNYSDRYRSGTPQPKSHRNESAMGGLGNSSMEVSHRMESIHGQLAMCDDKITNLTKLVKLSQSIVDQKESEWEKENTDLRQKVLKQEMHIAKLTNDMDNMQNKLIAMMEGSAASVRSELSHQLSTKCEEHDKMVTRLSQNFESCRAELLASMQTHTEVTVDARFQKLADAQDDVRGEAHKALLELSKEVETRFVAAEKQRDDAMRELVEHRTPAIVQQAKDAMLCEVRHLIGKSDETNLRELKHLQDTLEASLERANDHMVQRLGQVEDSHRQLQGNFKQFCTMCKDDMLKGTDKVEALSRDLLELSKANDGSKEQIHTAMEHIKDWANKNMTRLKKQLDATYATVKAQEECQGEMNAQMQHMRQTSHQDKERLQELLSQKTKEAKVLSDMVDKEIQQIAKLTERKSTTKHSTHREVAGSGSTTEEVEGYLKRSKKRSGEVHHLYNELAFQQ